MSNVDHRCPECGHQGYKANIHPLSDHTEWVVNCQNNSCNHLSRGETKGIAINKFFKPQSELFSSGQ